MITRLRALCTALVVTLVAYGSTASAATYTVTDIGTLAGGVSEAFAINARGDVVGDSTAAGGTQHAFLYQSRNGRLIDLDPRGANGSSYAFAINDRGRVAGTVTGPGGGASHAALFVRGHIIDLGTPPGFPTAGAGGINHAGDVLIEADAVVGILGSGQGFLLHHGHLVALPITSVGGLNNRRQVVGEVGNDMGPAVLFSGGKSILVAPGLPLPSFAQAINARGDIAGGYRDGPFGSTGGAFLEMGGVVTDLGTLPGAGTAIALGLNSRDQVVGGAIGYATGPVERAFVYDTRLDPPMQDLNDLIPADSGIVLEAATAINDDGIIVGIATAVDGHVRHAVVLKPHGS